MLLNLATRRPCTGPLATATASCALRLPRPPLASSLRPPISLSSPLNFTGAYPLSTSAPLLAGHNKWSKIRHKKGDTDTKRALMFSRLGREIIAACKSGGSTDPDANSALASILLRARSHNMPKASIDAAIKKSQGPNAIDLVETLYEGQAHGYAFMVECLSDNSNRAIQNVRKVFTKAGGALGSVAFMFTRRGLVTVGGDGVNADTVFEAAVEAGAEDVLSDEQLQDGAVMVVTAFADRHAVAQALAKGHGLQVTSVDSDYAPLDEYKVPMSDDEAVQAEVGKVLDALDELDDVVRVHSNIA
ncbi:transcriptional regulator-domain-containing protein [Catenaria anguillulae PL171]|uniref:Transcriptional regulator-domain-containing protein n=1 Tax=Catenaria anguillulae PL171 TaxID=765915 RepID=A0A1Y2H737_9FUNG|nr:transcriptional regulator-domain-containing protein [Catenaria anguillulae PL171]